MRLLLLSLLALPLPALADDVDETMKALGVEETRFEVAPKGERKVVVPASDDSFRVDLPLLSTKHRDEGQHYLDPFLGREVFPELGAQLSMHFVRQKTANRGEPNGRDGRIALGGRADLNLWIFDLRVPFDATDDRLNAPVELVLKAPFSVGEHRFAPMLIAHVPANDGLDESVFELAFGYHYARSGFGLKLEVSGFSATHDRRKGERTAGMVGWNAVASYLIGDVVGIVVEADGATAISERVEQPAPKVGDTVVRIAGGLRFFPVDEGFSMGLAGIYVHVPDGYVDFPRDLGVLFDIGYTFM
jgi:hypothetical protein